MQLPATFTLRPGGTLSPATVSAPASVPIALTVVASGAGSHRVTVETPPKPHTLNVPASGGRFSLQYGRLPKGSYPILVDGVVRAHLIVGVAPGP